MPRNRIIYQSEAVYAGPSPATDVHFTGAAALPKNTWYTSGDLNLVKQLQRIQSANYSFTVNRTDVNQFGQLAAIDRVILNAPTVSLDFSYLLANLANENNLGFTVASGGADVVSALSGLLTKKTDERNYFIKTTNEGTDAVNNVSTGVGVIGITSPSTQPSLSIILIIIFVSSYGGGTVKVYGNIVTPDTNIQLALRESQ